MNYESIIAKRFSIPIPTELVHEDNVVPESDEISSYVLHTGNFDLAEMLQIAQATMAERVPIIEDAIWKGEVVWGRHFSYKDWIADDKKKAFSDFEPRTGAIRLGEVGKIEVPQLHTFYSQDKRLYKPNSKHTENRGPNYYVAIDDAMTSREKLSVMENDIEDALVCIVDLDRDMLAPHDYLHYLGIYDVLKQHALSQYFALTYPERSGIFEETTEYDDIRQKAWANARLSTRMFYQTLTGNDFDFPAMPAEDFASNTQEVSNFILAGKANHQFKSQELDHPLLIGLSAWNIATLHPQADILIHLPSGGTQIGIATQMAYEMQQGRTLPLHQLPISLHSSSKNLPSCFSAENTRQYLARYDLQDKYVVVTEDNSNTGKSAKVARDAIISNGADEGHVCISEADIRRIIYKHQSENVPATVANLSHPDFQAAVAITPITDKAGHDVQTRKLYAKRVLRSRI